MPAHSKLLVTINGKPTPREYIRRLITIMGDDPNREGLRDTPDRVLRSYAELYGGYDDRPEEILERRFASDNDQMIVVRNIEFYSTCEHHLLPFIGKAHVAYIPRDSVVGLSKIPRLVECYARRLQIQEQMTEQIANAMQEHLRPYGVAVRVEARHLCMVARGVQKQQADMVTTALRGAFLEDPKTREEFVQCLK